MLGYTRMNLYGSVRGDRSGAVGSISAQSRYVVLAFKSFYNVSLQRVHARLH